MQRKARMTKELQILSKNPPHGISCWSKDDRTDHLEAHAWKLGVHGCAENSPFSGLHTQYRNISVHMGTRPKREDMTSRHEILGGEGTPYQGGIFKIDIQIPERYPFEPPKVRFVTPIYHPNIDTAGRICLDSLKMPPKGAWKPALNVSTLLTTIQLLMAEPNPEDPLMTDIANEYKYDRPRFVEAAQRWTKKHAMEDQAKENASPSETAQEGQKSVDQKNTPKNSNDPGTSLSV